MKSQILEELDLHLASHGVWLPPEQTGWENKKLQGIFFPLWKVDSITSVKLYWSKLSQSSPDLRGGDIDSTAQ